MSTIRLDEIRIPGEQTDEPEDMPIIKPDKRFIKKIPWGLVMEASNLPGKTLHVLLALCFLVGVTKSPRVKMQRKIREELGISRHSYSNCLTLLEARGVITVERFPGQTPLVTILKV